LHDKVSIKISGIDPLRSFLGEFGYTITNKSTGEHITSASRSFYKDADGSLVVNNGSFRRAESREKQRTMAGAASFVYQSTENMLRDASKDFTGRAKDNTRVIICCCANNGFTDTGYKGALVWAKHRYDWKNKDTLNGWKRAWTTFLNDERLMRELNIPSVESDALKSKILGFEYPYQFVELKKYLTKEDFDRGIDTDKDIKDILKKSGKYDLGLWFMQRYGSSWEAENYVNKKTGRAGHLNESRDKVRAAVLLKQGRVTEVEASQLRSRG